jgi:THO complex subunit 7
MAAIRREHETQNKLIQNQKSALDGIISDLSSLRVFGKESEAETTSVPQSLRGTPALDGTPALPDADIASVPDSTLNSNLNVEEGRDDKKVSREGTSEVAVEDDIEMGEVEEDPKEKNKKKLREELEEGEATDASSELSEPPDD